MEHKIIEIQGIKYFVPISLQYDFIYRIMINENRIYEIDLILALMKFISSDSIVVDVGGHIGNHSIQFAKKAKKVFAFEPIEQNYKLFEKNIVLNNIKNVELFKIAAADEQCKLKIDNSKLKLLSSSGGISLLKDTNGFIKAFTIDEVLLPLLNNKVSVMKFDVEEMEYQAILGSLKIIKKFHPVIYTELKRARLGSEQKLKDLQSILFPLGYKNHYTKAFAGDIWK